ncbi:MULTISPECIES: hypothetical protein [Lactobacillus]|uniref:hypothetical protein n=1 Tax=Lactobacillus TaxID=1578 RepID=UPI000FD97DEF|nr:MULTISPECIES: hypothetical protein [Lactobacillus]RVU72063.1 hypothetical protein EJK20_10980 [Lactobacillus xujianguonis]
MMSDKLIIDDRTQAIQGVVIPELADYQQLRFVVEMEHLEGWNPEKKDIEKLVERLRNPDPTLDAKIDKLFGVKANGR